MAFCFILILQYLLPTPCSFGFSDKVVAFVEDDAITLSEFQQQYRNAKKLLPDIKEEEVINTMINRRLILRDAKKYRIEAPTEDEITREYIDLKVRAFIKVGDQDVVDFYKQNISQFSGKDFEDVRDEIEKYLTEKDLNERLKETIKELRKDVYLKIQLGPANDTGK